jgi:hypothetical protein
MLAGRSVRFIVRSRTRNVPFSISTFLSLTRDERNTLKRTIEKRTKIKVDTVVTANRFKISTKKGFMFG